MELNIKPATISNIKEMGKIWVDFQSNYKTESKSLELSDDPFGSYIYQMAGLLTNSATNKAFIAYLNNGTHEIPVGYAVISVVPNLPIYKMKEVGVLQEVVVANKYRKMGVFKALFNHVKQVFRDAGITEFAMYTQNINTEAIETWKHMSDIKPIVTGYCVSTADVVEPTE
jgi:GNAT superfamily N-acetyltransferase